jgi:peroxiredoxin
LELIQLVRFFPVADEIKKLGVDDVYCLSVNDAFVMRQVWFDRHLQL